MSEGNSEDQQVVDKCSIEEKCTDEPKQEVVVPKTETQDDVETNQGHQPSDLIEQIDTECQANDLTEQIDTVNLSETTNPKDSGQADEEKDTKVKQGEEQSKEKTISVGTSTLPVTETPEVSSTVNDNIQKSVRSSRRSSYNTGRAYGGYQNYGLTYLPYKSNFEPSENARRKADEFFKTLKL